MPETELMRRLEQWGSTRAGVIEVIEGLEAGGYFRDPKFVQRYVEDLDGADIARLDLVAIDEFLMGDDTADIDLRKSVRRARAESVLWNQRRSAACMPGDRP